MADRTHRSSGPSQRQLRMGEVVRHALAEIFRDTEIRDDDLTGAFITVSEVRVSPDGRNATAYVMPLGGKNADIVLPALNRHAKFLRGELGHNIDLKFTPALDFRIDRSFDESQKIDRALKTPKVAQDLDDDT
ncbi:MAG: 30S ribosome-binding factor RbfA [Pseudomonadota bacterium]